MILRTLAVHVFRLGMRAFPPSTRRAFGRDALTTFELEFATRRQRGLLAAATFTVAAFFDALRAGVGERRRLHQRNNSDRSAFGPRQGKRTAAMGMSWIDVKLGVRMLMRYPGLTAASALALAIAIGIGAGWYDVMGDFWRPRLPLPGGDRIIEIEMRNAVASGEERRILHDFTAWRRDAKSVEELSAYRTVDRNLLVGDSRPEPITVAEMTASTFRLTGVAPALGRVLIEGDEHPSAPAVVILGYSLWQGRFAGRSDIIGQVVQIGRTKATVVGVMPAGYAFPVNHRAWMALRLAPSGYQPLEGSPVRVVGRIAPGATQAQVNAELLALVDRTRAESPRTHEHLSPRALAYGGESPGDRGALEFIIKHLPVLLVLLVACANVGTLIYARTATREGEIVTRYALGATRGRIVGQLFVEALVLATLSAVVGLVAANWAITWGLEIYYAGSEGMPFWIHPGLKPSTAAFAAVLTVIAAAVLGILPALKATRGSVQAELRNLGSGGSTLKFGALWTTVMVAQVALTVACLPPAAGISHEAIRDRGIRSRFPAEQYLAVRLTLDREAAATPSGEESAEAYALRFERTFSALEGRLAQEPGVRSITFADRLPGMGPAVQSAEVEVESGSPPVVISNLWSTSVGQGFFEAFDVPLVAGRQFHDGDRVAGGRNVLVNEAFVRRYLQGASPVGRRVRYASADPSRLEPWFDIVGVVRDIGMTPTDDGEAPYVYRPLSPATTSPLVMGIRVSTDPAALTPRLRAIAAEVDPGLRLDEARPLDDVVWRVDVPMVVGAGTIITVVALGLFLSAAGIFALMSVSVARRTREIGLRAALGASPRRLLAGIFKRALVLIGSGVLAGNVLLITFVAFEPEVEVTQVWGALLMTSAVMVAVGLLACVEPARRALRIQPTDALKDA